MSTEKTIYDLELHEDISIGHFYIVRVASGWIYTLISNNVLTSLTFVPFDNKFQEILNKRE